MLEINPTTSSPLWRKLRLSQLPSLPPLAPDNLPQTQSPALLLLSYSLGARPSSCLVRPLLGTPGLPLTHLPGDRLLTYPACESAPRCSQALKETGRNDVTCPISQQNRMPQVLGDSYKAEDSSAWPGGARSPMEPGRTGESNGKHFAK